MGAGAGSKARRLLDNGTWADVFVMVDSDGNDALFGSLTFPGAPTNGVNEVQRLTPGGVWGGGTFTITYSGQTTAPIAYNATAAIVQAALEALSNVAPGDIVVSGATLLSAGGNYDLTFGGVLGGLNVNQVTTGVGSLTGTVPTLTPSTVTGGVRGTYRGAPVGAKLQDTTNGVLYSNTGTRNTPVWTDYSA